MKTVVNNKSKFILQLQKLRKLSQPFFLPIDQCNGFQFIWLLISLLFCVGGVVLVGLTGIISFFESFQPIFLEKYFGGVVSTCLLYTSPSPRDKTVSRMPSSA